MNTGSNAAWGGCILWFQMGLQRRLHYIRRVCASAEPNSMHAANPNIRQQAGSSLAQSASWIWRDFERTPGLEHYRRAERYAAWQHTHRQLMRSDREYAAAGRHFYGQMGQCLAFAIVLVLTTMGGFAGSVIAGLGVMAAIAAATLFVAREQRRRNRQIGERLSVG